MSFSAIAFLLSLAWVNIAFLRPQPLGEKLEPLSADVHASQTGDAGDTQTLATVIFLQSAVSIINIGCYAVILPITVRDSLGGGALEIALIAAAFWLGSIATALFFTFTTKPKYLGRWILAALTVEMVMLAAFGWSADLGQLCAVAAIWGAAFA